MYDNVTTWICSASLSCMHVCMYVCMQRDAYDLYQAFNAYSVDKATLVRILATVITPRTLLECTVCMHLQIHVVHL